jgi:hypothetical protein
MANGDEKRLVYIVNFVLETPRRKCEDVLEDLPCKLKKFHKRARAAVITIKPKNVKAVLDALAQAPLVIGFHPKLNGEEHDSD